MHDADDSRIWLTHHKAWTHEVTDALARLGRSVRSTVRRLSDGGYFCVERLRRIALTVAATTIVASTLIYGTVAPALWA